MARRGERRLPPAPPAEPPVGPKTLDLGPEPPALANFLVHGFRVTSDAVPATLLDLAARNLVDLEQRGPGVYFVSLRPGPDGPLTSYERRVLELLEQRAHDVVPAGRPDDREEGRVCSVAEAESAPTWCRTRSPAASPEMQSTVAP